MSWRIFIASLRAAAVRSSGALGDAVMPRLCAFCGTECTRCESFCCRGCHADLPWNDIQCGRCAKPLQLPPGDGVDCAACQQRPPPFSLACAPLRYAFPVDAAIKALKFRRRLDYLPAFGAILSAAASSLPADIDALLPVPLHWRRHASRGFNQAAELCKPLQRRSGLPVLTGFHRARATPYQSGLSAAERSRNLRAAFKARGHTEARHVLIVDDVITTGETCRQLAGAVLAAGAESVSVLALARAGP